MVYPIKRPVSPVVGGTTGEAEIYQAEIFPEAAIAGIKLYLIAGTLYTYQGGGFFPVETKNG